MKDRKNRQRKVIYIGFISFIFLGGLSMLAQGVLNNMLKPFGDDPITPSFHFHVLGWALITFGTFIVLFRLRHSTK